jgi:hypothetical protein
MELSRFYFYLISSLINIKQESLVNSPDPAIHNKQFQVDTVHVRSFLFNFLRSFYLRRCPRGVTTALVDQKCRLL